VQAPGKTPEESIGSRNGVAINSPIIDGLQRGSEKKIVAWLGSMVMEARMSAKNCTTGYFRVSAIGRTIPIVWRMENTGR